MIRFSPLPALPAVLLLVPLTGCFETSNPIDVMGNFAVTYVDNLRVYIGDDLVATVASGEEQTITYDGGTFTISQVCGDDGTNCPSESWWRTVAVDQPWGPGYSLLNFVNLDLERGTPGQRMGGTLDQSGSGAFSMLSGLGVAGANGCAEAAVGTVTGSFSADGSGAPDAAINDGIIAYQWGGGCQIGDATISTTFRLESDFTAARTGAYDVSSVTPAAPIDAAGDPVDPAQPGDTGGGDTADTSAG